MRRQNISGSNRWSMRSLGIIATLICAVFVAQCTPDAEGPELRVGMTLQELLLEDARICSDLSGLYPQELIDGIGMQLIDEMRCMDASWLEYYTPCKEVGCIWANGPQPLAARPEVLDALREAATAKNDFITINAAYRDVAMQYFSRWRTENCDSSFMAAIPGRSNHQGGRAVDVQSYGYWADTLTSHGFNRPYYPKDLPHFELVEDQQYRDESEQLKSLSILAFQVLWNKNHPNDQIDEDGLYGPMTKSRLGNSPIEGFPIHGCAPSEPDPCDTLPCRPGCDPSACQQYCDADPCAEGCDPSECNDACAHNPCADGCDAQACDDYCDADPCADGCSETGCQQLCDTVPCAEGCPIQGCSDLCDADPCAPGCAPSLCTGHCEAFPCDDGCDPQACAAFCIRHPCDESCGQDACDNFCASTPCASVCEGSETCDETDPELCRGEDCEEDAPPEGGGSEGNGTNDPESGDSTQARRTNDVSSGCAATSSAPASWGWLFVMTALGVLSRRQRRLHSARSPAQRRVDA